MRDFLLVIQYLSVFLLLVEAAYIFTKKKTELQAYLFIGCVATLINSAGYLLEMTAESEEAYLTALKLSYLGRVWVPFSLFIFVLFVCKFRIVKALMIPLGFIHAATFFLVLTCRQNDLYYTTMEYVKADPIDYIKCGHGPWYIAYSAMLLVYIVWGLTSLFITLAKERHPIARRRLGWITGAIVVESVFYVLQLCGMLGSYDATHLGYTIGTVFMYVAIFKYDLIDNMQQVRDYVIDEVSEAIIALTHDEKVEFCNNPAKMILSCNDEDFIQRVADIKRAAMEHIPMKIGENIYSPEIKPLYQNDIKTGEVIVLVDDTEHYKYLEELKKQKDIAEAANASKSAFLSVVSHEIRTPMNAVVGMTEILLRDSANLNKKQEKYLRNIKSSGNALVMIVNDILDRSKIEAGKMELVEAPYELRPVVEDVKLIIENRIGNKPIKLLTEISNDVPKKIVGDSLRIRQILINLMNNAVKFTDKGYIKLSVSPVGSDAPGTYRFTVKDSGQGIKPEDLSKLGEAFRQVDQKKNHDKEGTGLGLSISKDFIEMMGGSLQVSSVYGEGTEFFFEIEQKSAEDSCDVNSSDNIAMNLKFGDYTCPDARILVVDDTELNLLITKEIMEPLGATVDVCDSGREALKMIEENTYNMVFTDYFMPYMDGVETTERIRGMVDEADKNGDSEKAEYLRKLPIVALTGDSGDDTKDKFIKAGISDFTEKPVDISQLNSLIFKWLPEKLIVVSKTGVE